MSGIQKWQILRSQTILDHQWCRVRQDQVRLPDGQVIDDFFVNVRPDVALVLALTCDREVIFVRQYRHGVGEILLELPAGSFDPQQETAEVAAQRELREETGYGVTRLTRLATLYDNPVKDTNQIHLFLAEDAVPVAAQKLDLTEAIEVVLMPLVRVPEAIARGEICVAGTLAALFLGLQRLH